MVGRVLARSQHRNDRTSSCLREGLMDNQDSEIVFLKFVAYHVHAKQEDWYEKEDVMGLVYPILL